MALLTFFRVDKRNFDVGDKIYSANEFQALNPLGSDVVEKVFESVRPKDKPLRNGALYLFEDIETAKTHWAKMKNAKLYEVELEEASVAHRGDMRLVDGAFSTGIEVAMIPYAEQYWSGELTQTPRVELLTSECAVVIRVISKDESERHRYFRQLVFGK